MKPIEKEEIIKLDNNQEYLVVDTVELEDKRYLYLIRDDEEEVLFAEEKINGEDITIETINDKALIVKLTNIILERSGIF